MQLGLIEGRGRYGMPKDRIEFRHWDLSTLPCRREGSLLLVDLSELLVAQS
jgi:hypothetical protein